MEDEQHLLLGLHQLDQPVPHQVQDATDLSIQIHHNIIDYSLHTLYMIVYIIKAATHLSKATMVPRSVGNSQQVGQTGVRLQIVNFLEVKHLHSVGDNISVTLILLTCVGV